MADSVLAVNGSGGDSASDRELASDGELVAPWGTLDDFVRAVMANYDERGRDFPWRRTSDPWAILVSEVMLQQTQTVRVVPKYEAWMAKFPTVAALASAPLSDVLAMWRGLGYNRRAVALREAARALFDRHSLVVPDDERALLDLPGVGSYTARAVLAFAFLKPVAFIETNIRAVFLHFFFQGREGVTDREIMKVAEAALNSALGDPALAIDSRVWHYALMDYGAELKKLTVNPNRASAHYAKQTRFEGSVRQARGAVLVALTTDGDASQADLYERTGLERERLDRALRDLVAEGVVVYEGSSIRLAE